MKAIQSKAIAGLIGIVAFNVVDTLMLSFYREQNKANKQLEKAISLRKCRICGHNWCRVYVTLIDCIGDVSGHEAKECLRCGFIITLPEFKYDAGMVLPSFGYDIKSWSRLE